MISYIHYIIVEKQNTKPYSYQMSKKNLIDVKKFSVSYIITIIIILLYYIMFLAFCEIKYDEAK